MIGEEQLLGEADSGLLQETQPGIDADRCAAIAPGLPPVVEPQAVATGEAAVGDLRAIGAEPDGRPAAAGGGEQELEPAPAGARGARKSRAPSWPRPSGAAASVAIAAVLATVVAIALESGRPAPSAPPPPTEHKEREALAPHPNPERSDRVERPERAIPEPRRADGAAQSRGSSPASPVPTRPMAGGTAAAPPAPAPPNATPGAPPTEAAVRDASPAIVQEEFGP